MRCRSAARGGPDTTQVVYAAINLRASPDRGANGEVVSTKFIESPKLIPVGTRLELGPARRGRMSMTDASGTSDTSCSRSATTGCPWTPGSTASSRGAPVERPADLTDQVRDGISAGRAEVGISRPALFLAIGYPPATQSATLEA